MRSLLARVARRWRRPAHSQNPVPQWHIPPLDVEGWRRDLAGRGWGYWDLTTSRVAEIKKRFPAEVATTLDHAAKYLGHEFDLLGSGWYHSADPTRPKDASGYAPIDWRLDPVQGLRFPGNFPHREYSPEKRPGRADIKFPWELTRCQHFASLGQAYRLTGESRFALEIARQIDDFRESEPVGMGVNWVCTMDVGLRAVNWCLGLGLIHDCAELDGDFWKRAGQGLLEHGHFIEQNLENHYEVTSNHYLSNVVGLLFLGDNLATTNEGARWYNFAIRELEKEMDVQVLADGADFESSIPYHRLVTELFLGSTRLVEHRRGKLSEGYCSKLKRMARFLVGVLRPDGRMPQIGDADDGRLHLFTRAESPQDPRALLGPASMQFDEESWLHTGGTPAAWEAAWWGWDVSEPTATRSAVPAVQHFPDAGIAVLRTPRSYLLVSNGIVGTKGFGNHKHNDQLSFEYHVDGTPILVDPGSYVYTSDPDARNRFRSTDYHNTVSVDGEEQNELRPEYLFRLFASEPPTTWLARQQGEHLEYLGCHRGYQRLPQPVSHLRMFRMEQHSRALLLVDRLQGEGKRQLRWHFHLAPGVAAKPIGPNQWLLHSGSVSLSLWLPDSCSSAVCDAEYSPSYGVRQPCLAIDGRLAADLGSENEFYTVICPHEPAATPDRFRTSFQEMSDLVSEHLRSMG